MPIGNGLGPTGNISGCALWFKADSLDLNTSGSRVTTWLDVSGSGNDVTFPAGNSSTTFFPAYYPNIINGLPVVRFSGSNYLGNTTNSQSLQFRGSGFTSFCVFATTGVGKQVVFASDAGLADQSINFVISISSVFQIQTGGTTSSPIISANSSIPINQFIIRHDRFDNDNTYKFGYFGVDFASGNANLTVIVPPTEFYIGESKAFGYGTQNPPQTTFQGDIAEIVIYNKQLTNSQVSDVNNYLYNKYFLPPIPPPGPSGRPFVIPPDLSGLFGWYRSTSIGITGVDGSKVIRWQDDSGSGNHVSIDMTQSGSWVIPTFYRNQIHSYPIVRFINGGNFGYLYGNCNDFSQSDLTTFCVFNTIDGIDLQSIYSYADASNNPIANISINHDNNNSFSYSYNSVSGETWLNSNSDLYVPGKFVIRHDRFRVSDGEYLFGRYGADIASGVATTFNSAPKILTIGGLYHNGDRQYIGDMAEIISYSRKLSDNEVELVNNYLLLKYQPDNVNSFPLFIYSTLATGIYNDVPLYELAGNSGLTKNIPLYIGSNLSQSSGLPLYQTSTGSSIKSISLYTQASNQQFPPLTLYIQNNAGYMSGVTLNIQSSRFNISNFNLYISGGTPSQTSNIPLYTISNTGNTTIMNASLIVLGGLNNSLNVPLYTQAANQQFPPISLYVDGMDNNNKSFSLYINGTVISNINSGLSLFLKTTPIDTNPSSVMPLFIGTPFVTGVFQNGIGLFLQNDVSGITSPTKRFYIRGEGTLNGGSIATSPMFPLFLQQTGITPVVQSLSNGTNLFVGSDLSTVESTDLYTISEGVFQSGKPLYQSGSDKLSGGIYLYMEGRDLGNNNNTTLYINGF